MILFPRKRPRKISKDGFRIEIGSLKIEKLPFRNHRVVATETQPNKDCTKPHFEIRGTRFLSLFRFWSIYSLYYTYSRSNFGKRFGAIDSIEPAKYLYTAHIIRKKSKMVFRTCFWTEFFWESCQKLYLVGLLVTKSIVVFKVQLFQIVNFKILCETILGQYLKMINKMVQTSGSRHFVPFIWKILSELNPDSEFRFLLTGSYSKSLTNWTFISTVCLIMR